MLPQKWKALSCVPLFGTPLSMEFSRPEYWNHPFRQGIFPTQGSNPGPLHCRQILFQLSPRNTGMGSLSLLQGIFPMQELNQGLMHCRHFPGVEKISRNETFLGGSLLWCKEYEQEREIDLKSNSAPADKFCMTLSKFLIFFFWNLNFLFYIGVTSYFLFFASTVSSRTQGEINS